MVPCKGFSSAGVPPAPRPSLFQNRRPFLRQDEQDAGATSARYRDGTPTFPEIVGYYHTGTMRPFPASGQADAGDKQCGKPHSCAADFTQLCLRFGVAIQERRNTRVLTPSRIEVF